MLNSDFGEPHDKECPFCGHAELAHTVEKQPVRFSYGPGKVLWSTVIVEVPVTTCKGCEKAWTDARADTARERAVAERELEMSA